MKNKNENEIFRRIFCPIYHCYVFVEISCIDWGCSYWNGARCTHERNKRIKLPKRGYRPERLRLGRRDRGRNAPSVYEKWGMVGPEDDISPNLEEGQDYGFEGSFEEGYEPQPEPWDMEDAGLGELETGEPEFNGEPEIVVGEPDTLGLQVPDLLAGQMDPDAIAGPMPPSPLAEPVIGPPGPSPVSDPVLEPNTGLKDIGGLPDPDDPFGGNNGL
jgi:hypothetical protein